MQIAIGRVVLQQTTATAVGLGCSTEVKRGAMYWHACVTSPECTDVNGSLWPLLHMLVLPHAGVQYNKSDVLAHSHNVRVVGASTCTCALSAPTLEPHNRCADCVIGRSRMDLRECLAVQCKTV